MSNVLELAGRRWVIGWEDRVTFQQLGTPLRGAFQIDRCPIALTWGIQVLDVTDGQISQLRTRNQFSPTFPAFANNPGTDWGFFAAPAFDFQSIPVGAALGLRRRGLNRYAIWAPIVAIFLGTLNGAGGGVDITYRVLYADFGGG